MKKLKVFHGPVNYGTQAGYLAKGLRELGIYAKSYTNHDPYSRLTDYQFHQRKSLIGKIFWYKFGYPFIKLKCFYNFNTFHFYFGRTLHARQWDLPFYSFFGKKVIMHYLGNDIEEYQWSLDNYRITNMRDLMTQEQGVKHDLKIIKRRKFEKRFLDAEIVCAPQYKPFVPEARLLPLVIDLNKYNFTSFEIKTDEPLRVLHAPTSRKKKGTQYLISAISRLQSEGYKIDLDLCEGITIDELRERYKRCHISVVALLGGWYGTAGIESMAIGRPIITFLRNEFFTYTSYKKEDLPIISANSESIYSVLKEVYRDRKKLPDLGIRARQFVEKEHSYLEASKGLIKLYKSL